MKSASSACQIRNSCLVTFNLSLFSCHFAQNLKTNGLIFILNSSFLILNCPCQWQTYTLPYDGLAYELAFYNLNTGVSCGHTVMNFGERIYYTTNSGNNWIFATCPPTIRALVNLQFINAATVYACGAENVYGRFINNYIPGFNSIQFYIRQRLISKGISEYFSEYKTAFLKQIDL